LRQRPRPHSRFVLIVGLVPGDGLATAGKLASTDGLASTLPAFPDKGRAGWVAVDGEARATIEEGRNMLLMVRARPNDTFESLAARYAVEGTPPSALVA